MKSLKLSELRFILKELPLSEDQRLTLQKKGLEISEDLADDL